jgi:glycosyltransferase involved in cell wall biosynthesis
VRISVIIPVRGDLRLARCLEGMSRQAFDPLAFEVLVVEDGATREVQQLADKHAARYLSQPGRGAYAARNRGVEAAQGELLAFTDADCLPPSTWLAAIESVLAAGHCEVAVGPSYALNRDPVGLLVQAIDDERWARLSSEGRVTYCDTRNLAGRRAVFAREPFDEAFRHGGDLEWGVRVSRHGCRILFVPAMALGHENVSSLRHAWRRGVRRGRGLAGIHRKHGSAMRISGARPLTIAGVDVKAWLLATLTQPMLRPLSSALLIASNAGLMVLLAGLLAVPPLRPWARRPFVLFDRMSLLLGRVLG